MRGGSLPGSIKLFTLKIWFRFKHNDHSVMEIYHQPDPVKQVNDLVNQGGFWAGPRFIPLHCISRLTIEQIEEAEPGEEKP